MSKTTAPRTADTITEQAIPTHGVGALSLPPTHDLLEIVQLADAAGDWVKAQTAEAPGRVVVEDPTNLLTLQLAAAIRREAGAKGVEVAVSGPDSRPIDGVAWDACEGVTE
jgi:hypothetical protein